MRTVKLFALGALVSLSVPVALEAQRAGAIEVGGFGRVTRFGDSQQLDNALAGGVRAGIFLMENLSAEVEVSQGDADVNRAPTGVPAYDALNKVSHQLWNYRLLYNLPMSDNAKLLLGAGYAYDAYGRERQVAPRGGGASGLVGVRYAFNDRFSLRVEGTAHFIGADGGTKPTPREGHVNLGAQAGVSVSFFTKPAPPPVIDTVTIVQRDTLFTTRFDTVTVAGRPVVIGAVQFAFNRDAISDDAKAILDQVAASLLETVNMQRTLSVVGNTDGIGSERFNMALGQKRADQVRDYLVSKGVAASRINATSAGESVPLAPNRTDNGRATNRRVLITLSN